MRNPINLKFKVLAAFLPLVVLFVYGGVWRMTQPKINLSMGWTNAAWTVIVVVPLVYVSLPIYFGMEWHGISKLCKAHNLLLVWHYSIREWEMIQKNKAKSNFKMYLCITGVAYLFIFTGVLIEYSDRPMELLKAMRWPTFFLLFLIPVMFGIFRFAFPRKNAMAIVSISGAYLTGGHLENWENPGKIEAVTLCLAPFPLLKIRFWKRIYDKGSGAKMVLTDLDIPIPEGCMHEAEWLRQELLTGKSHWP